MILWKKWVWIISKYRICCFINWGLELIEVVVCTLNRDFHFPFSGCCLLLKNHSIQNFVINRMYGLLFNKYSWAYLIWLKSVQLSIWHWIELVEIESKLFWFSWFTGNILLSNERLPKNIRWKFMSENYLINWNSSWERKMEIFIFYPITVMYFLKAQKRSYAQSNRINNPISIKCLPLKYGHSFIRAKGLSSKELNKLGIDVLFSFIQERFKKSLLNEKFGFVCISILLFFKSRW